MGTPDFCDGFLRRFRGGPVRLCRQRRRQPGFQQLAHQMAESCVWDCYSKLPDCWVIVLTHGGEVDLREALPQVEASAFEYADWVGGVVWIDLCDECRGVRVGRRSANFQLFDWYCGQFVCGLVHLWPGWVVLVGYPSTFYRFSHSILYHSVFVLSEALAVPTCQLVFENWQTVAVLISDSLVGCMTPIKTEVEQRHGPEIRQWLASHLPLWQQVPLSASPDSMFL